MYIIIKVYFQHLLEENTVCPRRPSLLIGELHLLAWTEQESHACNVNQALDRKQKHFEVIFLSYYFLYHHTLQMSFKYNDTHYGYVLHSHVTLAMVI